MSTIEIIRNSIQNKFLILNKFHNIIEDKNYSHIDKYRNDTINLENVFDYGTVRILIKRDANDQKYFKEYQIFINRENFPNKLNRLFNKLHKIISEKKLLSTKIINTYIKEYNDIPLKNNVYEESHVLCEECLVKMKINNNLGVIECMECGKIEKIEGSISEEDLYLTQDGQKIKHGNYEIIKHAKIWLDKIQAEKPIDIPDGLMKHIKKHMKINNIKNVHNLSHEILREFLKKKYSSYNEYVPWIRKKITGESPPKLTEKERQITLLYVSEMIHIFNKIKPEQKTNCSYHPSFIHKALEQIIDRDEDFLNKEKKNYKYLVNPSIRKKKIMSCIHLQSKKTLDENDRNFKEMCKHIKDFVYIPTDRYRYQL